MELKEFCDETAKKAEGERSGDNIAAFSIPDADWSKWPGNQYEQISLLFFKNKDLAKKHLEGNCLGCDDGDIYFETYFDIGETKPSSGLAVLISYIVSNEALIIGTFHNNICPGLKSDKILSIVDLPGSTLIMVAPNGLFKKLTLDSLTIRTERGQIIEVNNPTLLNVKGQTLYEYVFPDSTQH
jgi:hypothetical protein